MSANSVGETFLRAWRRSGISARLVWSLCNVDPGDASSHTRSENMEEAKPEPYENKTALFPFNSSAFIL